MVVGSDAYATRAIYYRYLTKSVRGASGTVRCNRVYYYPTDPHSDLILWPFLAELDSHYQSSNTTTWYFPKGYSFYGTNGMYPPYTLVPSGQITGQQVPDDWGAEALESLNQGMAQLSDAELSAINGFVGQTQVDSSGNTNYVASFVYRSPGTVFNGGVVTYNEKGVPELRFPESDGYVHGYKPVGPNQYEPTYYRIEGNQSVELSQIESVNSSSLSYDSTTGLYSFNAPDYSTQLASISRTLESIRDNQYSSDFPPEINVYPDVTVNPEVTVRPEVTVNPSVTVNPDVTVNVTAPTQNDITVAIDNSDVINSIESISDEIANYADSSDARVYQLVQALYVWPETDDVDLSSSSLSQEENQLLQVPQGWNTQFPLIGNAANVTFGAFLGNIPNPPRVLRPLDLTFLGFHLVIDFSPYSEFISWFRSFVLLAELIWFLDCVFRSVVRVMAI